MAESGPNDLAVLDGELMPALEASIPAADDGFLRGDGVFEALRVYRGQPFGLEEHLQRLLNSAEGMHLREVDVNQLAQDIDKLVDARGAEDYAMRIVCTRGGHRLVLSEPLAVFAPAISLAMVEYRPTGVLDGLKTLSYGANVQANRIAQERGFDESLLVTPEGQVLEAPTASIFWSPDGEKLVTPPLGEGILASITRHILLGRVEVEERATTRDELLGATEAFLCASIREVQAVNQIEDTRLPVPGPLTTVAKQAYAEAVEARLAAAGANIS